MPGSTVHRKTLPSKIFDISNYIVLTFLCFITLYPFWYVLVASLTDPSIVVNAKGLLFWPEGWNFGAYIRVLENPIIGIAYLNTLFYVVFGVITNIICTTLAAYTLSRKDLYGKNVITLGIVFTMFFTGGLIPLFLLVKNLGLIDTRWSLILPNAINTFNFIIMRTGFAGIPNSMEESAKIDGASHFTILAKIYVPLAKPIIAVMVLFYAVQHWNSWFWAMVYLRTRILYPVQLILREILIASDVTSMVNNAAALDQEPIGLTVQYATIIITMVPITIVYPFLQRYFVKGIMVGSLKE